MFKSWSDAAWEDFEYWTKQDNMKLIIEPATFSTPKWMRLKSLLKYANSSLGLPEW